MAAVTGKRKREERVDEHVRFKKSATNTEVNGEHSESRKGSNDLNAADGTHEQPAEHDIHVQIVTGSYERILHGVSARIPSRVLQVEPRPADSAELNNGNESHPAVTFSDTFLFAAHTSSIRCLAVSPSAGSDSRTLATGGSDERINLYSISTSPSNLKTRTNISTLPSTATTGNRRNQSLGSLIHHERAITRLQFPAKSKLFSAAEDNTVAVSRTRDWTVLSSVKAPIPIPHGRPSGDTAGPGEVPAGINDFAIHPSQKLMLSVSRGERCMRLWNLMTGKKAGVLNFDRDLLVEVGEGRFSSGEGRKVLWDEKGEIFVIGFERGAIVFGTDSKPKAIIQPLRRTKFHQMKFVPQPSDEETKNVLAVSTEDGRLLFFDVRVSEDEVDGQRIPRTTCIAELGGPSTGISGRIKDFEVLELPEHDGRRSLLTVTGSSDGAVRLWVLFADQLNDVHNRSSSAEPQANENGKMDAIGEQPSQVGKLIATLETGNRITCTTAFILDGKLEQDNEQSSADPVNNDVESESESDDSE